ncbi:MAG: hypothetical protein K5981_08240 [Clostridia bacterium]|nr:hypothetical protein [Clostridia bacterium]
MKKLLSLLLALAMAMSAGTVYVFADDPAAEGAGAKEAVLMPLQPVIDPAEFDEPQQEEAAEEYEVIEELFFEEDDILREEMLLSGEYLDVFDLAEYMFLIYYPQEYLQNRYYEYELLSRAEKYGIIGNVYAGDSTNTGKTGLMSVYSAVLDTEGLDIYPYWVYTGEEPAHSRIKDVALAVYKLGMIDDEQLADVMAGRHADWITRPVTASQVEAAVERIHAAAEAGECEPHPEILERYAIANAECSVEIRNDVIDAMAQVYPQHLEDFISRGFKVRILSREHAYRRHVKDGSPNYNGLYVPGDKEIVIVGDHEPHVNQYEITYHEFGHFLFVGKTKAKELFEEEGHMAAVQIGVYSKTNKNEYMAEVYRYLMAHKDDHRWWDFLKDLAPKSYEYVVKYVPQ